ncbi:A24 family peptidase [Streptomyces sp. NPDC051133]|uniref:prepilin peptidase n=1 Tax=Streptomyces sp. NPDC051133 TaxID=3155521 RepID=UPI00341E7B91
MAVLWGAGVGLLIPRAAYRLSVMPEEPWRTACPAGHPLAGIGDGWLGRARCADGDTFGPRTPIIALVMIVVCALLAAATGARPELLVWLLLAPIAALLATVDFAVHRLPDVVTLPLAASALIGLGGAELLPGAGGSWRTALLGSLTLGACYFVLFLINPRGFGFGDVKLAPALGAVLGWYGWGILLIGTFAGYLLGALYGVGLILARRAGRKSAIPFGPFLLAGAFAGILLGSRF